MHIAIIPVLQQKLVSCKVILLGMFKDQNTAGLQYVVLQYFFGNFPDARHIIRRIGKNNIILQFTNRQKVKNIIANNTDLAKS